MATELEELQAIRTAFTEYVTYVKARDDAAALAAQTAADDAAAQKVLDDVVIQAEKQAETDFRTSVVKNTTDSVNLLTLFNEKEFPTAVDNSTLLSEIVDNTSVTEFENQVGTLSYYADVGLIIMIFGVIPIYLAYRFIHPIIGMVNKIL